MKRIAVFGGTFNPAHVEHIKLAKHAVAELGLDKLFIMPTYLPPHKNIIPAPATDRLEMLKIAFKGVDKVEISDYEISMQGKSYTYLTVEHFKSVYPDAELFFIVGGDMLTDFKNWRFPERIMGVCTLATFGRDDYFTDYEKEQEYFRKTFGKEFVRLSYEGERYSSTKIRVYSAFGLSISGQVADGVEEYIKSRNLYGGDIYTEYIKKNLPLKRIKHTADVVVTAMQKVKELKLDGEKVRISATLHDCAKYFDKRAFKDFSMPIDVPQPVEHAFLGEYVARTVLGVADEEILDAIKYHTSGKPNMTTLGKLIFVADMVEEGRTYEGVEELRKLYEEDFERCFVECLKEEVLHLINKKQYIYSKTLEAYDYYCKK